VIRLTGIIKHWWNSFGHGRGEWTAWLTCGNCAQGGKHRTEATEVTEAGLGLVAGTPLVDGLAHVRELRAGGKHRTEVTEVTEAGLGLVAGVL
jgi:hypothetical protein